MGIVENIDDNLLKDIKKLALKKNTSQYVLINKYLKEGIENELSLECMEFYEELDEIRQEIKDGKGIRVEVGKLEEHFGL